MEKIVIGYGRNEDDWNTINKIIKNNKKITDKYKIVITHNKTELKKEIVDADIFFGFKLSKELFQKAKTLKWIHISSAGVNHTIYPKLINSDVLLTSSKGIHGPHISEHVIAFILYFSKAFNIIEKNQRNHKWEKKKIVKNQYLIQNKKALIYGYGNIGKQIGKKLLDFNIDCFGVKKHKDKDKINGIKILTMKNSFDHLHEMDFVIDILPLTDKTENIFDKKFFKKMKKDSIFVNVGRGKHIVENDLLKYTDHLKGIGLDVTPNEPLSKNSQLWDKDNVLLTQHSSGDFKNYVEITIKMFVNNLKHYDRNEKLFNIVDKEEGY